MKIFLDTANLDEIRQGLEWGIVEGITTNPTSIAKGGIFPAGLLREVCAMSNWDVSAPVIGETADGMVREGRILAEISGDIVVKLPCTEAGIKACAVLTKAGTRTNVTLVFNRAQALLAAKAGAYIVSPFIGRVDDLGYDGIAMIREIAELYRLHGLNTQILAASVRSPKHVIDAAIAGAHIATMPLAMLSALVKHPLTDSGLEKMLADYKAAFQDSEAAR